MNSHLIGRDQHGREDSNIELNTKNYISTVEKLKTVYMGFGKALQRI